MSLLPAPPFLPQREQRSSFQSRESGSAFLDRLRIPPRARDELLLKSQNVEAALKRDPYGVLSGVRRPPSLLDPRLSARACPGGRAPTVLTSVPRSCCAQVGGLGFARTDSIALEVLGPSFDPLGGKRVESAIKARRRVSRSPLASLAPRPLRVGWRRRA